MNEPVQATRLLDLINAVDNVPLDFDFTQLYKLLLPRDPRPHGFLLPTTVASLPWTYYFTIDHAQCTVSVLDSSRGEATAVAVNAALQSVVDAAVAMGPDAFPLLDGRHSEHCRIVGANLDARLERYPAPLFGILSRGAHMTAYVRDGGAGAAQGGGIRIWVARRGRQLFTYPGMLDTSVAGGVKASDSPLDCVVAEADEEASLPSSYVRSRAVPGGAVTYVTRSRKTGLVSPTVLYVFDLEMGAPDSEGGIKPVPKDGEVEAFYLWDIVKVKEAMMRGKFKPNCCLVMIDFFVRHGIVTEENEGDYLEILTRLHRRLPVPTAPERDAA